MPSHRYTQTSRQESEAPQSSRNKLQSGTAALSGITPTLESNSTNSSRRERVTRKVGSHLRATIGNISSAAVEQVAQRALPVPLSIPQQPQPGSTSAQGTATAGAGEHFKAVLGNVASAAVAQIAHRAPPIPPSPSNRAQPANREDRAKAKTKGEKRAAEDFQPLSGNSSELVDRLVQRWAREDSAPDAEQESKVVKLPAEPPARTSNLQLERRKQKKNKAPIESAGARVALNGPSEAGEVKQESVLGPQAGASEQRSLQQEATSAPTKVPKPTAGVSSPEVNSQGKPNLPFTEEGLTSYNQPRTQPRSDSAPRSKFSPEQTNHPATQTNNSSPLVPGISQSRSDPERTMDMLGLGSSHGQGGAGPDLGYGTSRNQGRGGPGLHLGAGHSRTQKRGGLVGMSRSRGANMYGSTFGDGYGGTGPSMLRGNRMAQSASAIGGVMSDGMDQGYKWVSQQTPCAAALAALGYLLVIFTCCIIATTSMFMMKTHSSWIQGQDISMCGLQNTLLQDPEAHLYMWWMVASILLFMVLLFYNGVAWAWYIVKKDKAPVAWLKKRARDHGKKKEQQMLDNAQHHETKTVYNQQRANLEMQGEYFDGQAGIIS